MKNLIKTTILAALLMVASVSFAQGKRGMKGEQAKAKMEKMAADLELTDEQVAQVKAIFKAEKANAREGRISKEEMEKLSKEDRKIEAAKMKLKRAEAAKSVNQELRAVLSAEQFEKYEMMKKQQMEKRKEFREKQLDHKPEMEDMHQEEPSSNG